MLADDQWNELLFALRRRRCVVFLGPGVTTATRGAETRPLTEWLALDLAAQLRNDYPNHPLEPAECHSLLYVASEYQQKKGQLQLQEAVEKFYAREAGRPAELHTLLADLPLHLVISTGIDTLLSKAYRSIFKNHTAATYHYRKERSQSDEDQTLPDPTPDQPLVYNLLGAVGQSDALVLTEKDRLNFLEDVIRHNNAIPNTVLKEITKDKVYLFFGFDFEQWHLRILLRALNLDDSNELPLYAPAGGGDKLQPGTQIFFQKQFKMAFLPGSDCDFIRELQRRWSETPGERTDAANDANIEVFYMYDQTDAGFKDRLDEHLAILRTNRIIRTWDESAVAAGDEFQSVVAERLDRANLILLLVSSSFLASERLYNGQLQLAMKRFRDGKAVICPILVRPCLYEGAVFSKLYTLLPRNKVAVADWKNPDSAYEHIAQQISQFVDTLAENLKTL